VREKLNESKTAQIALVAVLVIAVAVIFLKPGGGGGGGGTELTVESSQAASVSVPTEAGEIPASLPDAEPLPHRFLAAYDADRTVALLVVHDGGIDDRYTKRALEAEAASEGVTVITIPAKRIPRYASLTVGLDISQLPALIVMRPKSLSHGAPQASVDYGFQTPRSVYQTIVDASYKGPEDRAYHPG